MINNLTDCDMVRNENIQFKSQEEIKAFQEERLREEVKYLYENSRFYREMFDNAAVLPDDIKCIEDLKRLPVTTKKDLQLRGEDFICVSKDKIIDYVTTSGTLGDPVTFALTDSDMDRLAYNEYLSFTTAGVKKSDIMQLMTTLDRRFMAGLAYFMGARELGCGVIRVGNGIPELQWDTIKRINPTVCMVVPSFLIKLMEYAEKAGIDYKNSPLKKAICIGEALRDNDFNFNRLGQRIHAGWPTLQMYSTYASTEMQSSFTECECQCGGHHQPDLIIVEFLDDNNNEVPLGEPGEVTITTLGVRGMPLLRFKTGDVCYRTLEKCGCGRQTMRLSPVLGRKGQMIKYKGTTLYPSALYDILDNIPEVKNYMVEVYTNNIGTDEIRVRIGTVNASESFIKSIKDTFRAKVRVAPDIIIEPIEVLAKLIMPPMSRKPVKFVDLRGGI